MNIKNVIKGILSYKNMFVKSVGKNVFISNQTRIKGYKNIKISDNTIIEDLVKINIDGKNSLLDLNSNVKINRGTTIYIKNSEFKIKKGSFLNEFCTIYALANIRIGKNVMIGPKCNIIAANHNYEDINIDMINQGYRAKGIEIDDNVWLGANVTILDGVKINSGSIIAAGSVVTRDVPKNSIYGGVPARIIKERK